MLPHQHFLIAAAAAAPFSLHHPEWILVSGLVSAAVDTDVVVLVYLNAGKHESLRQFVNPINIFRWFGLFMQAISDTGILKTAMKTHIAVSAAVIAVSFIFFKGLLLPVSIGVVSHILSDIPNISKALGSKLHASQK